jgi:N-methylhydantoinase A/oxoprolinase/acetone carboxylase beta subunit
MRLGLGIDAGGTYTDSVLSDFSRGMVLASSKAPTTHDDYARGIVDSIEGIFKGFREPIGPKIKLVSLSTTLATNAIVEGKGGVVGLVLVGYDRSAVEKIRYEPKVTIKGRHSIDGETTEPLDRDETEKAIGNLLDQGVEAFAVSSEVGVRNPSFEFEVSSLIRKRTDAPVVCGSQLTRELNCVKRANTCLLNARLMPLVVGLLQSVKRVLDGKGIVAPLMVVKGDGTLMGEDVARENPIEMVLSGPAASVVGGSHLSKLRDGWVIDIGGTTTDITHVRNGMAELTEEGLDLNGLRMASRTVNDYTMGLGGDSYIRYDRKSHRISVGPERVMPICYLASLQPRIQSAIREQKGIPKGDAELVQPCDFFVFVKRPRGGDLHPQEVAILRALEGHGTMSRAAVAECVKASSVSLLRTERLEADGHILRSALTPTDILHAQGVLALWNGEAAKRSVSLYAKRAGLDESAFMEQASKAFYRNFLSHLFQFVFMSERTNRRESGLSRGLSSHLIDSNSGIQLTTRIREPIVFVGAPASECAVALKQYVDADLIVPEHHAVANAVGAITSVIREEVTARIRPMGDEGYVAFTPVGRKEYENLEKAKEETANTVRRLAVEKAQKSGAVNLEVQVDVEDSTAKAAGGEKVYIEAIVRACVLSTPTA